VIRIGVLTPHRAVGPEEELPAMAPGRVLTCVARVSDDSSEGVNTPSGLRAMAASFYWHFDSREALVEAALADWEHSHTTAVIAEIEAASADPLQQLRLLFKRVTELAARDRIELALLATADHATVEPLLNRVTRRRIDFAARLFGRLGVTRAEAKRRALLAYSAYLGYAQLLHATPQLLPRTQAATRAYLNDVLAALTSPPSPSEGSA
jgi:AcrR family transcriptional regulator